MLKFGEWLFNDFISNRSFKEIALTNLSITEEMRSRFYFCLDLNLNLNLMIA